MAHPGKTGCGRPPPSSAGRGWPGAWPATGKVSQLPDHVGSHANRPAAARQGGRLGSGSGDFPGGASGFAQFRGSTEKEMAAWLRRIFISNLANLIQRYYGTRRRNVRLEGELDAELEQSSRTLDFGLAAKQSSPSHVVARREQALI